MNLRAYQEQFAFAVRHQETPHELATTVRGGGQLSSLSAVDVYRTMYWYRLVDAHFDLFPKTARLLGAERFTKLVCACLTTQPSRTPVLERLAVPFAHDLATRDVPRAIVEVAQLEALAIDSLISENPPFPLFTRTDAASPELENLRVALVPSCRLTSVAQTSFDLFRRTSVEGEIAEKPMRVDARPAEEDGTIYRDSVGVAFCRPVHSVLHHTLSATDLDLYRALGLAEGDTAVGELLLTLAGPQGDIPLAFRRLAFLIDHQMVMLVSHGGEPR